MKLTKFTLRLLAPKSAQEDIRRREFILNVFLAAVILLLTFAFVSSVLNYFFDSTQLTRDNNILSFAALGALLSFFCFLFFLSRKGRVRLSSYLLLAALFVFAAYLSYRWSVDLPAAILFDVLVIVIAGVLIGTSFAFYTTIAVTASIAALDVLQNRGILIANRYWANEAWNLSDVAVAAVMFGIIATVSWLSNREIERSLARAKKSEHELKVERDQLEIRVEERTQELRQAQMEKMTQAYRFVEFGRLAGGLFHDLGNPLTALSLNIQNIAKKQDGRRASFSSLAQDIVRAKRASEHIQTLMDSMRRHLSGEGTREMFSAAQALEELVCVLAAYARAKGVTIVLSSFGEIETYGDASAFTQAIANIVSNAIEAYSPEGKPPREVRINASEEKNSVRISVRDFGPGIPELMHEKIFEPFFTTKSTLRGLGIGLSLAKRVIEKEFNGTILVENPEGGGTSFVITFPLRGLEP